VTYGYGGDHRHKEAVMANPAGALGSAVAKLIALYRREPAATQTAAAVVFAGGDMLYRVYVQHTGVLSWAVVAAAAVALYGLMVRAQVIPVAKLQAAGPAVVPPAPPAAPPVTTA
jgi:hypothetical protein